VGEEYPSAEIIGTDISLIQPSWFAASLCHPFISNGSLIPLDRVPPNVRFEIDDAGKEWTFRQKFDYIHVRALVGSLENWPAFLEQCYKYAGVRLYHDGDLPDLFTDICGPAAA